MKSAASKEKLFDEYWQEPNNTSLLRVWADALIDDGDLRGELIQLSIVEKPTQAQRAARAALIKKHGGKLVGPAREFLRSWTFGPLGLVDVARCDAEKCTRGIARIECLNPRLILTVTSLKPNAVHEFAKLSLERIYCVDFTGSIGYQGGTNISDDNLTAIAPAFSKVRHVNLYCVGYADECFSPAGLSKFADQLQSIEVLALSYGRGDPFDDDPNRPQLPPLAHYLKVIAEHPRFSTLLALYTDQPAVEGMLGARAAQVRLLIDQPCDARDIEEAKRPRSARAGRRRS